MSETLRTKEEVLELLTKAQLAYGGIMEGIVVPEFTCEKCEEVFSCSLAFDLYNTNGDCLAEK